MLDKARVLFIGLDSAEPDLIREWTESGDLPVLRALRDESAWGPTTAPAGFGNGVFWPSLYTGANAAKHGRYYRRQIRCGTYKTLPLHEDTDIKADPIWTHASRAGKRVAVIDMVRAGLGAELNGIQLVDWLPHDPTGSIRSWPPDLAEQIAGRYGTNTWDDEHGLASRDPELRSAEEYSDLCKGLCERVAMKTRMSRDYLNQGNWDLFMTVYADPHDIGHQCWHFHDPSHPDYDPNKAKAVGDPMKSVYREIDAGIGELLEQVGPETAVIVFTGPGMGPGYSANVVMDQILQRLEESPVSSGGLRVDALRAWYRRAMPSWIRTRIRHRAYRVEDAMRESNRRDRKCFALQHNSNAGAIRVNLVGREPDGKVHPGAEFKAFCDALIEDLMDLVNVETGKPLVEEVVRVAERFHGDYIDDLPDLMVVWNRPDPIQVIGSQKIGEIKLPYFSRRTGDHTPHGLYFVRGPDVRQGEQPEPVSVMDVAATIAGMVGVTIPDGDGVPIPASGVKEPPAL
jgi:predicted AlkP superfamily phosphohydrolase/phosphomutase